MSFHNHFSLMLPWDTLRNRTEEEFAQDLLTAPFQVGPIALLDNMIVDNPGFFKIAQDKTFRFLIRKYVDAGLLVFWHRPRAPDGTPITHAEDLLRIWLARTGPEQAKTVFLLRGLLR